MKRKIIVVAAYASLFLIMSFANNPAQNILGSHRDSLFAQCKKFYYESLYSNAVDVYKNFDINNLSAEELFYLGLSLNNLRRPIDASQYFGRAVQLTPEHNGYRLQLARTLSQLGKTNEAISNYENILSSDSNNVTALYELGLLNFDKKEYGKAIRIFSKLVNLNINDFLSSYYLGYTTLLSSDPKLAEQAVTHLEHSVAVNPEYVPAISLLASNKFSSQKYYDAISLYGIARKLRPENADFDFKSGLCYEKLELFRDAAELYSKAVSLDASDATVFDHLGYAQFNLNNFDSAATAYKKALELDNNPTYYVNLGFCYARMDSAKESLDAFQKALQLMPFDKIGYIYNQIAAVYYSRNNFKESKKNYEEALLYNPENIDAQFYVATINDKMKNYKTAAAAYGKVVALARDDSTQTERIKFSTKRIKEIQKGMK